MLAALAALKAEENDDQGSQTDFAQHAQPLAGPPAPARRGSTH